MTNNMLCPRLLIVSNDCISQSSSNGRTLRNFLVGWDKNKVAQFCIHLNYPDYNVCDNYFCVSDNEALNSFLHRKSKNTDTENQAGTNKQRNAITTYLRDLIWDSGKWKAQAYYKWIDDFNPEVVLLQAGDSGFMYKIAMEISDRKKIPLVLYNSEGYYFKDFDYFKTKGIAHFFYKFYHKKFCKRFKRTISKAKTSIYINEGLKAKYDKQFNLPSEVIYTSTEITPTKYCENTNLKLSYLGNLGVGRHKSLIKIAEILNSISSGLKIDVYGKIPNNETEKELNDCKNINYCGFVSYEQVQDVIKNSDIILHVENFSEFYIKDSVFAFSTKIADSLACGRCFLMFAPKELACTQYLMNNDAAYVATTDNELETILNKIIEDKPYRMAKIKNALELVRKNHNATKNADKFKSIILAALN